MGRIQKHLEKMLPKIWDRAFEDPRRCERCWPFQELMGTAMRAMLSGFRNLRQIERFTYASGRRVPDTTLHDLLVQLDVEAAEEELARGVKEANRNHELDQKELPFSLTVIDGKNASCTSYPVDERSINRSQKGKQKYVQHFLKAFHGSSTLKVFLAQERVPKGTNEKGIFPCLLEKLISYYGRTNLLDVFSFDAGFLSIANARAVTDAGYRYLFALKDPRTHTVTRTAMELLSSRTNAQCVQVEETNGEKVTRSLYRCAASPVRGWEHAVEFWRVHKVRVSLRTGKIISENHYYVSNLPRSGVSNAVALKIVRMHWTIENNANWVLDVAWKEDKNPWCNAAIDVLTIMRMMAYNIVARFKLRSLKKTATWTWQDTLEFITAALFPLNESQVLVTR
jgi:hypothetical protein